MLDPRTTRPGVDLAVVPLARLPPVRVAGQLVTPRRVHQHPLRRTLGTSCRAMKENTMCAFNRWALFREDAIVKDRW